MQAVSAASIPVGLARDPHVRCLDCGEHQIPSLVPAGPHGCPNLDRHLGYGPADEVWVDLADGWRPGWACGVRRYGPDQAVEVEVKVGVHVVWVPSELVKAGPTTTYTDEQQGGAA